MPMRSVVFLVIGDLPLGVLIPRFKSPLYFVSFWEAMITPLLRRHLRETAVAINDESILTMLYSEVELYIATSNSATGRVVAVPLAVMKYNNQPLMSCGYTIIL